MIGSVPDLRKRSQEPSAKFIFTPSFSSVRREAGAERGVELAGADALDEARALVHRAVHVAAVVVQRAELLLHAAR